MFLIKSFPFFFWARDPVRGGAFPGRHGLRPYIKLSRYVSPEAPYPWILVSLEKHQHSNPGKATLVVIGICILAYFSSHIFDYFENQRDNHNECMSLEKVASLVGISSS